MGCGKSKGFVGAGIVAGLPRSAPNPNFRTMADNDKQGIAAGPLVLVAAGIIALAFVGYFIFGGRGRRRGAGFEERAQQAGLAFQMHNLPNEQGARFRINLYDHGSGLAVGDYDNDGRDDIYFLNQHGPNALYRNKGDGTFEGVTASKTRLAQEGREWGGG